LFRIQEAYQENQAHTTGNMPHNEKINCVETPNAPICQIYPLLFRSHSENTGHNDKTENSDHIIQVLFSAHSAEAAIYVLLVLLIYAIIFVILLHSSIGEKEDSNSDIKQSLIQLQLSEAQTTVQQHGTSSQLINLGNGSKKLCTRSATQIVQETNANNKTKCEPVRPGMAKLINEDDEELMLSDQPEQVACFV